MVGLLLVAASARVANQRGASPQDRLEGAPDLPGWAAGVFTATYALGAAYVIVVVGAVLLTAKNRGRLPLVLALAAVVSIGGVVLASFVVDGGWPDAALEFTRPDTPGGFPAVRVAIVTAVLLVLRPWIVVSFRRFNALVVLVECVAAWAMGIAAPPDITGALGVGMVAAGAVLVLLGSPGGHPDLGQVSAALGDLGIRVADLRFAERQSWGARTLLGMSDDGQPLLVKVYGRDASDAQLAARSWRGLVYRDQPMSGASRLQLVEHQALVTILAERAGAVTTPVLAAVAGHGDAMIVLCAPPPALADLGEEELSDDVLRQTWDAVGRMHSAGICHGQLTLQNVGVRGHQVVFSDFAAGSLGSPVHRESQEVATLLTAQAVRGGADRAVDAAIEGLGPGAVASAQAYLQRAALPRPLRSHPDVKSTLSKLRTTITKRTGVEPPPPAQIGRVRWRDVLQTALVLLAAYALLTMLGELDWKLVIEAWANASWIWILIALIVAQTTVVADSMSIMSLVTTRLPLVPMMHLQYAIKFVGLAISATAGRLTLNTSFLRRFGVGPTVAVTASALDSVAGFIVKIVILAVALLFADGTFDVATDASDGLLRIIGLIVLAVVAAILVVAAMPRVRSRVVGVFRDSWSAMRVVTRSPSRGFMLLGSNLASLLITAAAMACIVEGINPSLPYGVVVAVTAASGVLATLLPVPGNVGVAEAAITAGLVAVGVPSGPAFAIAVTQRICTSYLPPVIGVFSLRWLRRQDYVG